METFLDTLRWVHVVAGFTGLAAFWIPIFTRKGGRHHRLYGKVFKYCAYLVLAAAGLAIAIRLGGALGRGIGPRDDPGGFSFAVFLGYLTVVTFIGLRHGIGVLQHKQGLAGMDRPLDRALAWVAIASSIALVAYAVWYSPPMQILLFALSPIGLATGLGILKAIGGRRTERKAWFYEHMGAMMGTGVAFHTAFAVFGATRIFELQLSGWIAIVPWIAPALIGAPAITLWTRHYQRRFGDLPV